MNILQAIESLKTNGGFSFNISTGELNPTDGFMVAINKEYERIVTNVVRYKKEAIEKEIKKYITDNAEILSEGNTFIVGAWVERHNLYLDISEKIPTELEAIKLCVSRNRLSYYDNATTTTYHLHEKTKTDQTAWIGL